METKYDVKRLLRTGTLLALLFAWMLTGSFVANSQIAPKAGPWTVDLTIVGGGMVDVTGYPNTIVGPVSNSIIGPFADGSLLNFTATALPGYTFTGWSAPIGTDDTPEEYVIYGNIALTATFKKVVSLSNLTFVADDKDYDGNANATGTVAINPGVIDLLDVVTVSFVSATFDNASAGDDKTVTFTGVALGGADASKYVFVGTIGTALADIDKVDLSVSGAIAQDRDYTGNTNATVDFTGASLTTLGYLSPNVNLVTTGYSASFDTKNVGDPKVVTVTGLTLGGSDAANYILMPLTLNAKINPKLVEFNVVITNKVYDGTTSAVITSIVVKPADLIGSEVVSVSTGGYVADFADANVGNGKTVNITAGITLSGAAASNYAFAYPIVATGNIVAPVYAMFTPTYAVGRVVNPVANVPLNTDLTIQFSANVYDENGATLNGQNVGEFIKLIDISGGGVLKPFTGSIVGNKVTILPNTPLEYSNTYEIYFEKVYTTGGSLTGSLVTYTCDKSSSYDPTVPGALVADDAVQFITHSEITATLPVVTPFDAAPVCGNVITATFVNPLTYVNLTPLSTVVDAAKHKFSLESSTDGVTYTVIPVAEWTVTYSLVGTGGSKFTFAYNNGAFEYNKYYRVRMNVGLDLAVGFIDAVTSIPILDSPTLSAHTQGFGWDWLTTDEYPVKAYVNYTTVNTEFGTRPNNLSNVTFDGSPVITYGAGPAFATTVNNDFTADVTDPAYPVTSTNGEGYHVANWSRSTNGSSWTVLPTSSVGIGVPVEGQNWAAVPSFSFNPNTLKPTSCSEQLAYRANFDINKYNVVTAVAGPVNSGTVTPVNASLTNLNHGTAVALTATPNPGYYFVGWSYVGLPGVVTEPTPPDHTAIGYPATGKNGTLSFQLVGALTHGQTFNVTAIFDSWEPRIYAATDPQNAFTGLINATVQFGFPARTGFGQEGVAFQGLDFDWESYVYNTPVKLEAVGADCRYEFVKWQKWNPAIVPAGAWVDYPELNPTSFVSIVENIRLKAVYKLIDDVKVSATANDAPLGTVIIFTDATRTTPRTINGVPANQSFTHGETVYITSYPDPNYYTWRWTDAANVAVTMGGPVRFVDRSEWTYTVGCADIDLKAFIDWKEYPVTVKSTLAEGTINGSNPAFNAILGNQGGLGFSFSTAAGVRTGTGNFQRNSTVNFVATAATNWEFSHWETPGGIVVPGGSTYTIDELHGPVELIAKFVSTLPPAPTYALTVSNAPVAGGTVSLPSGNYLPGSQTATATAAPGYTFTGWTTSPNIVLTVPQQTANPLTFTMPAGAATLTANYALTEYSVTPISRTYLRPHTAFTIVNWGGSVTKTPAAGTFNAGEYVEFTAVENPGFTFVNWMVGELFPGPEGEILRGDMVSSSKNFTWKVPAVNGNPPMYVYAIFIEDALPGFPTYALTTAADPAGYGDVTGAGTYPHSVQVYVEEDVTEPGYEFDGWSPNVNPAGDYVNMITDQHVVANYSKINYTLFVESSNPAWGSVAPGNPLGTSFVFDDLPIAVSAEAALPTCNYTYEFDGWYTDPAFTTPLLDAGGNAVMDESFNFIPYALPTGIYDIEIFAKFNQIVNTYDVTAVVAPDFAGTASISPVGGSYTCGQTITINTVAYPGYEFQHWTKDGVLFIDQETFNWSVDEDADFVAVYTAIEYDVTATAQPGGVVAPPAQIKTIGQLVEVTATANTGYEFDGWVATGVTLADAMANPASFNQPANDVSLVAKFVKIIYDVTASANAGGTVAPVLQQKTYLDPVTVEAFPAAGYTFNGWTPTDVTLANVMANPVMFNMPANDVNLVASFAKIPYAVTVSVAPSNGGTTTGLNATSTYYIGDAVSVTATANPGFQFVNWSGAPLGATVVGGVLSFTMPAAPVSLTANFVPVNNKLTGYVKYFNQFESGLPLSAGIKVALLDAANNVIDGPDNIGMDGAYEFVNIVPGTTYKVKVWEAGATLANTWSWNNWGGASAADALIISYMAAGNNVVNNFSWIAPVSAPNYTPFAVEVADVDNNSIFTGNDPLIVMRRSIGLPGYSPFPIGGAPNFQVAGGEPRPIDEMVFPDAPSVVFAPVGTYAAGTSGSDFYYLGTITGEAGVTEFNIYYIAGGDVNASYVPQGGAKAQPNMSYKGIINANVGDVVNIPVTIDQNVDFNAMNMSMTFNSNMIEVLSISNYDAVNVDNSNGTLNVAWFDAVSRNSSDATLIVNARILSDISATDRLFELNGLNEISDASAQVIEGVSFTAGAVNTTATNINEYSDLTANSYPNPFTNEATISYTMPEAGKVNVIVYNKLGQVVKVLVNEVQNAGVQTVRLNSSDLNGNGTYLYKILVEGSAKSYTVNGTLILVK